MLHKAVHTGLPAAVLYDPRAEVKDPQPLGQLNTALLFFGCLKELIFYCTAFLFCSNCSSISLLRLYTSS